MVRILALAIAAALALGTLSAPAAAQDERRTVRVDFAAGTSGETIRGRITGYEVVRYLLGAQAGQRMTVALNASNIQTYFNVLQPSLLDGPALAVSSMSATNDMVPDLNRFDGILPESGDYVIEVYMMRAAARRDEVSDYTLEVAIGPGTSTAVPAGDAGDGVSGGPDYWAVNVATALNLRAAPSTSAATLARLPKGRIVENRGCREAEGRLWCEVADGAVTGWAAAEYLVESAAPLGNVPYGQGDATTPEGYNATGLIPCATAAGMPMGDCAFGVIRRGGGDATVVVSLPGGGQRFLYFDGDRASSDAPDGRAVWERRDDLNILTVAPGERYEIPDAVRFGG